MSENSRIYPSLNPSGSASFPDCHWKLCRQFLDRYQSELPAEQLYALAHIFANTQLLLGGDADQTMTMVLDLVRNQVPEGAATTEVDHVENRCCCWEREAEPEFPAGREVVDVSVSGAAVTVKQEPEEVVEESLPENPELECPKAEETVSLGSKAEVVPESPEKAHPILPSSIASIPKKNVPSRGLITLDSVYQNLVLFDDDFFKTQTYFDRTGCGQLELSVKFGTDHRAHATIHVAHLILSQASAKDHSKVIEIASKQFFQTLKDQCYNVETLHPKNAFQRTTNIVQRIPLNGQATIYVSKNRPLTEIDPAHYEQIMRDFHSRNNGCHLVFAEDFTDLECNVMQAIAIRLELPGRVYDMVTTGQKRFLVLAKELPPQDVVRRIVTEKDAELGYQYRVTHSQRRGNARVVVDGKSSNGAGTSGLARVARGSSVPKIKQQNSQKKVKLPETLTTLTKFAPARTLRSVDDVYRNLVLIETDFVKTAKAFHKTKVGMLQVSTSEYLMNGLPCGFTSMVKVGNFLLAEARNNSRNSAKIDAKAAFFKRAKQFCYQIIKKKTATTEILVTKREVPDSSNCKRFFEDFNKDSLEKELVFSAEFSKEDIEIFSSTVKTLNLKACSPGEDKTRRLRILGQHLPALVIVERIVLANDPILSAIYEVIPPRNDA